MLNIAIIYMVDLKNKTFWKIGGKCNFFYEVDTVEELSSALSNIKNRNKKYIVIGNGTNILFDSDGFNDAVIKLGNGFNEITLLNKQEIEVGASTWVPYLVRFLSTVGYGGIEHCVGIPATIGGLIAMNGGSQRKSISENLVKVTVLNKFGKVVVLDKENCKFSYRNSSVKNSGDVILSATLKLSEISRNENRGQLLSILQDRRRKFPRKIPNCGSVFLSSSDLFEKIGPPGYVVESLGLKGMKCGDAEISSKHGNFIVNNGSASSSDILFLIKMINQKCYEKYGYTMKAEAIYYSKNGESYTLDEAAIKC